MPRAELARGTKRARAYARRLGGRVDSVRLVQSFYPPSICLLPLSLQDTELFYDAATLSWTWRFDAPLCAETLAEALGRALDAYPLFSARLVRLEDDAHGRRRLAISCCNQGALLSCISMPEGTPTPRDEWRAPNSVHPVRPKAWQGPPSLRSLAGDAHAPLLEARLVKYFDGCELAVKCSHGIGDGATLAGFVTHWARCFTKPGASDGHWPLMDRSVLDSLAARDGDTDGGGDDDVATPCRCQLRRLTPAAAAKSPCGCISPPWSAATMARMLLRVAVDPSLGFRDNTSVAAVCITFSKDRLALLKQLAASDTEVALPPAAAVAGAPVGCAEERGVSSFDVLLACLWRAVFSARKRRVLDGSGTPHLFFPINMRGRAAGISDAFVGNAVSNCCVYMDADALRQCSFGALVAAMRARKALAQREQTLRGELRHLEAATRRNSGGAAWALNPFDQGLLISDFRFPGACPYDARFGTAQPVWFTPAGDVDIKVPYIGAVLPPPPALGTGNLLVGVFLPADEVADVLAHVQRIAGPN